MSTVHCWRVRLEVGVHRIDDYELSLWAKEKWWQLRAGAVLRDAIFLCSGVAGILPLCPRSTIIFDWMERHL